MLCYCASIPQEAALHITHHMSVLYVPLTETIQCSDLEERLPMSGVTSTAILRSKVKVTRAEM